MLKVIITTLKLPPIPLALSTPIAGNGKGISSCACNSQFRSESQAPSCSRRRMTSSASASASASAEGGEIAIESEVSNSSSSTKSSNDVLVQYVVLRRDLIDTWPMGSVVTQGCHASVAAIWEHKDDPHTLLYCSPTNLPSMHKVTLEVKGQPQLLNLSEKLKASGILHALWMEQPENIPTCLASKPYPKSMISSFFKKLKLCK